MDENVRNEGTPSQMCVFEWDGINREAETESEKDNNENHVWN